MALPEDFIEILTLLGRVFEEYERISGARAILVGGAAVSIFTKGSYLSGDFDILAHNNDAFIHALTSQGIMKEEKQRGYYHPSYPRYGIDWVSGDYFDGLADIKRIQVMVMAPDSKLNVAPIEDLITDRLAQYASAPNDFRPLNQAKLLKKLAGELDMVYLLKRVQQEGGDPSLLEGT